MITSDDYVLLEGIKLLRVAPRFNKILQAFLSKERRFELIRVMLRILKEGESIARILLLKLRNLRLYLIELNLKGDKVEYLNLIDMFISEFGFDPLIFCKTEHNGRTTNAFRLVLDMYFKDELGQKTVKKYLEYFMLDLEKAYNVYEKVMGDKNDGKSVKQYFESKYEKVNKHRRKKGLETNDCRCSKRTKEAKKKAKRQRKKTNNNNNDKFDIYE